MSIDRFRRQAIPPAGASSQRVFNAHDFVWKHQRAPYDLVVYQLGNARWHDYMWAYLAAYPGLGRPARYPAPPRARPSPAEPGTPGRLSPRVSLRPSRRAARRRGIRRRGAERVDLLLLVRCCPVVLRTARLVCGAQRPRGRRPARSSIPTSAWTRFGWAFPRAFRRGAPLGRPRARLRRELGIADTGDGVRRVRTRHTRKRIEPVLGGLAGLVAPGTDAHLLLVGQAAGCRRLQRR